MLLEGRGGRETLTSNVRELNEVKLGSLSTDKCKHNKMIVQLTQDSHKLRVTSSFFFLLHAHVSLLLLQVLLLQG